MYMNVGTISWCIYQKPNGKMWSPDYLISTSHPFLLNFSSYPVVTWIYDKLSIVFPYQTIKVSRNRLKSIILFCNISVFACSTSRMRTAALSFQTVTGSPRVQFFYSWFKTMVIAEVTFAGTQETRRSAAVHRPHWPRPITDEIGRLH